MTPARFSSVEDYLASLDPTKAKTLGSIIDLVLARFPELEAKVAWNVPQIHRAGKYVLGVSASTNHLSVAPWSTRVIDDFRARLEKKFVVTKNLFQIPVDWEIDGDLIEELVRARMAELDEPSSR